MKYDKVVRYWLILGLVMIFIQVIVGGITRLTESGLSITKWEVIEGSIPPMNEEDWLHEFELYKNTPQYREVFEGMSLGDFKFIYFWEFIHRFWARLMGFVFLIPFLFFLWKKRIDLPLVKKLGVVVLFAALAAIFGWIMVASGLKDRPWVNAYKLSVHLIIAFATFASLFFAYRFSVYKTFGSVRSNIFSGKTSWLLGILLIVQIFFGGIMSGMKAGIYFPTWPLIGDELFPQVIFHLNNWNVNNFSNYDQNIFFPSLIQFVHRITAYLIFIICVWLLVNNKGLRMYKNDNRYIIFFIVLISQILLGIITVLMCKGEVPILWGVLHQGVALVLLLSYLNIIFDGNCFK